MKSTKSVLAARAAIVVLTGGAGSLAYWNATADVDGGEVDAGELSLTPASTTPPRPRRSTCPRWPSS